MGRRPADLRDGGPAGPGWQRQDAGGDVILAALAAFFAVNASLIVLRRRLPGRKRPFRVPCMIWGVPVPPVLAIAAIGVLLFHFEWQIYSAGAIALAATAAAFAARQIFRRH